MPARTYPQTSAFWIPSLWVLPKRQSEIPSRINSPAVTGFMATIVGSSRIRRRMLNTQPRSTMVATAITNALANREKAGSDSGLEAFDAIGLTLL